MTPFQNYDDQIGLSDTLRLLVFLNAKHDDSLTEQDHGREGAMRTLRIWLQCRTDRSNLGINNYYFIWNFHCFLTYTYINFSWDGIFKHTNPYADPTTGLHWTWGLRRRSPGGTLQVFPTEALHSRGLPGCFLWSWTGLWDSLSGKGKHCDTAAPDFFPEHEIFGVVLREARLV